MPGGFILRFYFFNTSLNKMASIKSIAIDTEQGFVTFRLVKQLCTEMGGTYLQLEELKSAPIVSTIQKNLSYGEKK